MAVIIDKREKNQWLLAQADEIALLDDIEQGVDEGVSYSYDICVICTETMKGYAIKPRIYKFERKRWPDFVASWDEGKLERQLSHVDGLIVEFDPLEIMEMTPEQRDNESDPDYVARRAVFLKHQQSAFKHLARLSANMWVIHSLGPEATMAILRWLEKEGHDLSVKPNKVKTLVSHPLYRVLDAVGHINMHRPLEDGRLIGEAIAPLVDVEGLIKSLRMDKWVDLDLKPAKGRRTSITFGTVARIGNGLRAPLKLAKDSGKTLPNFPDRGAREDPQEPDEASQEAPGAPMSLTGVPPPVRRD